MLVPRGEPLPVCDLVILPGSKATIADLAALRTEGWDIDLRAHHRRGGRMLGLCGGYQMLGRSLADPDGVEGPPGSVAGLGLLPVDTVLGGNKRLVEVQGELGRRAVPRLRDACRAHHGRGGADAARGRRHGRTGPSRRTGWWPGATCTACSPPTRIATAWLRQLGAAPAGRRHEAEVEAVLDRLAAHLELHVGVDALLAHAR